MANKGLEKGTLFFSLPELILQLHRTYQPIAEDRNLRLVIRLESEFVTYLTGSEQQLKLLFECLLSCVFGLAKKGRIDLVVHWKEDQLQIRLKSSETRLSENLPTCCLEHLESLNAQLSVAFTEDQNTEFTVSMAFLPHTLQSDSKETQMVLDWLLKDIEVSDIIAEVIRSLPVRLALIKKLISEGELETLKDSIHALKGVVGNFGMSELYGALVAMDLELKQNAQLTEHFMEQCKVFEKYVADIPVRFLEEDEDESHVQS